MSLPIAIAILPSVFKLAKEDILEKTMMAVVSHAIWADDNNDLESATLDLDDYLEVSPHPALHHTVHLSPHPACLTTHCIFQTVMHDDSRAHSTLHLTMCLFILQIEHELTLHNFTACCQVVMLRWEADNTKLVTFLNQTYSEIRGDRTGVHDLKQFRDALDQVFSPCATHERQNSRLGV